MIPSFLRYNDWADGHLISAAEELNSDHLDRPFDIGRGSLRRTLYHVVCAEHVWIHRWQGLAETPWPDEDEKIPPADMRPKLAETWRKRDEFLRTLAPADHDRVVRYRDSFGKLFDAKLGDMILQTCIHSTHHRAQVVNMFRRLGAKPPELDYMYWVRTPA